MGFNGRQWRFAGRDSRRLRDRAGCLVVALLVVVQLSGCTSFRAARAYQRGSAALDRGDATLAIEQLESAATLLPEASEIQNHLGIAYAMDGRDDAALAALRRAVALDCDNEAALRNLAAAEAQQEPLSVPKAATAEH